MNESDLLEKQKAEEDADIEQYDKINQQLKDYASLAKNYPKVIDDYKTYYSNKSIEMTRNLNNLNRQTQADDRIVSSVNSCEKFQGLLKLIGTMEKEVKENPTKKARICEN